MKKFLIFILSCLIVFISVIPAGAEDIVYNSQVSLKSDIALLISRDDSSIIFSKNADERTSPAGLTTIMTALVVIQNCEDLNAVVTVTQKALEPVKGLETISANLVEGEKISVLDLLHCMLIKGAADASVVLADYVAGSYNGFVEKMNATAVGLGCENTVFKNTYGLDEQGQYTTAFDIAKITLEALENSIFEKITSTVSYTVPATNLSAQRSLLTTNHMINKAYSGIYYYSYAAGVKTGSTETAGRCLVSTASKSGYNYLSVVMKGKLYTSGTAQLNSAFVDSAVMMKWAFSNLSLNVVAQKGQVVSAAKVKYCSKIDTVRLVVESDTVMLVPNGTSAGSVIIEPIKEDVPESISAPFDEGEFVCKADVLFAGSKIAQINLVTEQKAKLSVIKYITTWAGILLKSTVFKVIACLIVFLFLAYIAITIYQNYRRKKLRTTPRLVEKRQAQGEKIARKNERRK